MSASIVSKPLEIAKKYTPKPRKTKILTTNMREKGVSPSGSTANAFRMV